MPTVVYKYGARLPLEERQAVEAELLKAHDYYNELVRIERQARAAREDVERRHHPKIEILDAQVKELDRQIKELDAEAKLERRRKRSRHEQPSARSRRNALIALRKPLKVELAEERKIRHENFLPAEKELDRRVTTELERLGLRGPVPTGRIRREVLPALLKEQWPQDWIDWTLCNLESDEKKRAARARFGLRQGTYSAVEAAVSKSTADSAKLGKPPRFRWWDRTGKIGTQIQGGETVAEITSGKSLLLRIEPLPADQWETRSGRRHAKPQAWLRYSSDSKGGPLWAKMMIFQHRPLPEGSLVKQAFLVATRTGDRIRYSLQLTVDVPASERSIPTGRCAVDVGWRIMSDGRIRVGMVVDDYGETQEISVPPAVTERLLHSYALTSTCDTRFDEAKLFLRDWIRDNPEAATVLEPWLGTRLVYDEDGIAHQVKIPDWKHAVVTSAHSWRNHVRLCRLANEWSRLELGGDARVHELWNQWRRSKPVDLLPSPAEAASMVGAPEGSAIAVAWWLELWRRKDRHLYQWAQDVQRRALGYRRDCFLKAARRLANQYGKLTVEDIDLRPFCRRPAVTEAEDKGDDLKRAQRVKAAPGEFMDALKLAFAGRWYLRPTKHTTMRCHLCGQICEWDQQILEHTCEHCGAHWDQDVNAGFNLLDESWGTPGVLFVPKEGGRFKKKAKKGGAKNEELTAEG